MSYTDAFMVLQDVRLGNLTDEEALPQLVDLLCPDNAPAPLALVVDWDTQRRNLEKALIDAALALFEHTGSHAFTVPVPNTTPTLWVSAGDDSTGEQS